MTVAVDDLRRMYELLVLTRTVDERLWALNRVGKVLAVASCQGQEAAQVGSAYALAPGDYVSISYREHGVILTRGMTPRQVLCFGMARDEDINSRGRQIPGHYSSRELGILSSSSPVATQIPHAVGAALSSKLLGQGLVGVTYFGDGASSKGDFHESCNLAAIHRLPVIFFCQNNGWAISVPNRLQFATEDLAGRAQGYGFPGVVVDGNDVAAVYEVMREAVARARRGDGPTLIEAKTTRLSSHTSQDDDRRYRPQAEVEAARARDPLLIAAARLREADAWDDAWAQAVHKRAQAEVDEATAYAERAPEPLPHEATTHVYAQG
ncbi:MAG TPA: thiamine pyrophosphate-dependent dehydrogenase E1 component subunit alpha [Herpetosiphonaceae bacterium]